MSDDAIKTGNQLADVLLHENAALRRADYTAAAALVPRKESLIEALAGLVAAIAPAPVSPVLADLGERLRALAAENQALLSKAITVQARVVRIVAKAGAQVEITYTPFGLRAQPTHRAALGLSARA